MKKFTTIITIRQFYSYGSMKITAESIVLNYLKRKYKYRYSTTTAKVTRPSSLYLRRKEPPWRRIIWRETARPMPEPSVLVVKNGVKIFSATSAGIADPLFVNSICMRSSASIVERIVILRLQSCATSAPPNFYE